MSLYNWKQLDWFDWDFDWGNHAINFGKIEIDWSEVFNLIAVAIFVSSGHKRKARKTVLLTLFLQANTGWLSAAKNSDQLLWQNFRLEIFGIFYQLELLTFVSLASTENRWRGKTFSLNQNLCRKDEFFIETLVEKCLFNSPELTPLSGNLRFLLVQIWIIAVKKVSVENSSTSGPLLFEILI